jgi:Ser/Thr protein kinase RdoA (MazF antagonist)
LSKHQGNELLTTQPPAFTKDEAAKIAHDHFGLEAKAKPLWSERDQNFRLRTSKGQLYVLKIANHLENPQVIDFQTRALEHIAHVNPDLPVPRTIATREGEDFCLVADDSGRNHMVRLISWLDGEIRKNPGQTGFGLAGLHPPGL